MDRVLTGAFSPGSRIDVNEIAARDGVSPTPVRNALNRLVGAGLIVSQSNEGFFAPYLSEQELREFYDASAALLGLAIARGPGAKKSPAPSPTTPAHEEHTLRQRTEAAFLEIMHLGNNGRLSAALADIALRLRPVRAHESALIANGEAELRRILQAHGACDYTELDRLIGAYHRRRIRLAPKLLTRLHHRETGPRTDHP
nr:GntR family transcriptional regulator [Aquisalinus luteolus]